MDGCLWLLVEGARLSNHLVNCKNLWRQTFQGILQSFQLDVTVALFRSCLPFTFTANPQYCDSRPTVILLQQQVRLYCFPTTSLDLCVTSHQTCVFLIWFVLYCTLVLPRDAMHSAVLVIVNLSVCHTRRLCPHGSTYTIMISSSFPAFPEVCRIIYSRYWMPPLGLCI